MQIVKTNVVSDIAGMTAVLREHVNYILPAEAEARLNYEKANDDLDLYFINGNTVTIELRSDDAWSDDHVYKHSIKCAVKTQDGKDIGCTVMRFLSVGEDLHHRDGVFTMSADELLNSYVCDVQKVLPNDDWATHMAAYMPLHNELRRALVDDNPVKKMTGLIDLRTGSDVDDPEDYAVVELGFNYDLLTNNDKFRARLKEIFGDDISMRVTYYLAHPAQ